MRRPCSNWPRSARRRAMRARTFAICGSCCGRRSTTTTRAIWINSRVADPVSGGSVRILVAIADVDALVKRRLAHRCSCARQYHVGVYAGGDFFHVAGEALHGPDLARRRRSAARRRDRHDHQCRRQRGEFGAVSCARSQSRQAGLQRRRRVAATAMPRRLRRYRRCREWISSCGCRTRWRSRCAQCAAPAARWTWRRLKPSRYSAPGS